MINVKIVNGFIVLHATTRSMLKTEKIMNNKNEKQYRITVSESQLRMIAHCVEDCHRFMAGQVELHNCTSMLDNMNEVQDTLQEVYQYVVPDLKKRYGFGASYAWSGSSCPNELQRKFIAASYYLYREIKHFDAVNRDIDSVYRNETLRCEDSGMPIVIEEVGEE